MGGIIDIRSGGSEKRVNPQAIEAWHEATEAGLQLQLMGRRIFRQRETEIVERAAGLRVSNVLISDLSPSFSATEPYSSYLKSSSCSLNYLL